MLIKKKNNRGFTLVEVIVSMLVLSITIVSVLSAFVFASKSNTLTRKMQSAEAILADLVEYTNAYSREFDPDTAMDTLGRYQDAFYGCACTVITPFSDSNDVEVSEFTNMKEGSNTFKVRITRDRTPDEYLDDPSITGTPNSINSIGSIVFGETGSETILVNVDLEPFDQMVFNSFYATHVSAVTSHNDELQDRRDAGETGVPEDMTVLNEATFKTKVTRKIYYKMQHPSGDAELVQLTGTAMYTVDSGVEMGGASNTWEYTFYSSEKYDSLGSTKTTPSHVKQIYITYEESDYMQAASPEIYIWDNTTVVGAGGSLDANVFLISQQDTVMGADDAAGKTLADYFGTEKLSISVEGTPVTPTKAHIYCSAGINYIGWQPSSVTCTSNSLLATNEDVRLVTINIEVLDPETNQVLAKTKKPIACLQ